MRHDRPVLRIPLYFWYIPVLKPNPTIRKSSTKTLEGCVRRSVYPGQWLTFKWL